MSVKTKQRQVTDQVTGQVPEEVEKLVVMLDGEMKRKELQEALGLRHRVHFKNTYLNPALDLGLIEMTSPETPRSPQQRYRLTEAGRRWRACKIFKNQQ